MSNFMSNFRDEFVCDLYGIFNWTKAVIQLQV